jgi:diguanylate cyclase (GGDEF)-like protein
LLLFQGGVWLDFSLPLLGLALSSFSIGTYNFVRVAMERQNFLKMSITDGLTGLYNIRYFKMLLETETLMAKHDLTKKFAIIMSDVDHFKHFNDTYGHQVGDLVLKETANILRASVRSSDIVSRYGGEEMIVLLRGSSLKDGLSVAEKIRKTVEDHRIKNETQIYNITISMGVAIFKAGDTVEMIIKKADEALYQAKESGRNRVATLET